MIYQLVVGYLMPIFDSFVQRNEEYSSSIINDYFNTLVLILKIKTK